jgi:hypothetical protein
VYVGASARVALVAPLETGSAARRLKSRGDSVSSRRRVTERLDLFSLLSSPGSVSLNSDGLRRVCRWIEAGLSCDVRNFNRIFTTRVDVNEALIKRARLRARLQPRRKSLIVNVASNNRRDEWTLISRDARSLRLSRGARSHALPLPPPLPSRPPPSPRSHV